MWEKYKDTNKDSNVDSYLIGDDYIDVKFRNSSCIYEYTYKLSGKYNVEIMKKLAREGNGLNSYILKNCKELFINKK